MQPLFWAILAILVIFSTVSRRFSSHFGLQIRYFFVVFLGAARAEKFDKMNADDPRIVEKIADSLRDMQRAWITFRDAKCDWETVQWGGGTGAGPARLSCLMHILLKLILRICLRASRTR